MFHNFSIAVPLCRGSFTPAVDGMGSARAGRPEPSRIPALIAEAARTGGFSNVRIAHRREALTTVGQLHNTIAPVVHFFMAHITAGSQDCPRAGSTPRKSPQYRQRYSPCQRGGQADSGRAVRPPSLACFNSAKKALGHVSTRVTARENPSSAASLTWNTALLIRTDRIFFLTSLGS